MNRFKKITKYVLVLVVVLLLFRGFFYRVSVNYLKVKVRANVTLIDEKLIKEIQKELEDKTMSIDEIVDLSHSITSKRLSFTFDKVSNNPNVVCELRKGNCIGYSSLFNAIGNYIIKEQKMTDRYEFIHLVGKLDVFGLDVHSLINSSFFKDHDFNEIRNLQTGEQKFVDPSVRDYLRIEYVTSQKEK